MLARIRGVANISRSFLLNFCCELAKHFSSTLGQLGRILSGTPGCCETGERLVRIFLGGRRFSHTFGLTRRACSLSEGGPCGVRDCFEYLLGLRNEGTGSALRELLRSLRGGVGPGTGRVCVASLARFCTRVRGGRRGTLRAVGSAVLVCPGGVCPCLAGLRVLGRSGGMSRVRGLLVLVRDEFSGASRV